MSNETPTEVSPGAVQDATALLEQLIAKWRKEAADNYGGCRSNYYVVQCADELAALLPSLAHSEARRQELEQALSDARAIAESRWNEIQTHLAVIHRLNAMLPKAAALSPSSPVGTQE